MFSSFFSGWKNCGDNFRVDRVLNPSLPVMRAQGNPKFVPTALINISPCRTAIALMNLCAEAALSFSTLLPGFESRSVCMTGSCKYLKNNHIITAHLWNYQKTSGQYWEASCAANCTQSNQWPVLQIRYDHWYDHNPKKIKHYAIKNVLSSEMI